MRTTPSPWTCWLRLMIGLLGVPLAVACTASPATLTGGTAEANLHRAAQATRNAEGSFHATSFTSGDGGGRAIVEYAGPDRFRVIMDPNTQFNTETIEIGRTAYFSDQSGRYIRVRGSDPVTVGGGPLQPLAELLRATNVHQAGNSFTFSVGPSVNALAPKGATGTASVSGEKVVSISLHYNDGTAERTSSFSFGPFGSAAKIGSPPRSVVLTKGESTLPSCDTHPSAIVCGP